MPMFRGLKFHSVAPALVMLLVQGCGKTETGPAQYPVQGQVLYKSAPVVEGMIFFHPQDPAAGDVQQRPMAVTDENGRFVLTTSQPGDGAPAGKYAITVELRDLRADGDEMIRDGRNLLPEKYRSPKSSGLEYTVRAGENEVPLIDLK